MKMYLAEYYTCDNGYKKEVYGSLEMAQMNILKSYKNFLEEEYKKGEISGLKYNNKMGEVTHQLIEDNCIDGFAGIERINWIDVEE